MIHERPYTEAELLADIEKLSPLENVAAIWLDQARFHGICHHPRVRITPDPVGLGGNPWRLDEIPLFVVPTNGRRRLDVDVQGGATLVSPYVDRDLARPF